MALKPHVIVANKVVAANAYDTITVPVGGSDFYMYACTAQGTSATFNFNVKPSDTSEFVFTKAVPSALVSSTSGGTPFLLDANTGRLSHMLYVTAGSSIDVTIEEGSGAQNTIWVTLIGYKRSQ